jgi:hypothetical protein
MDTLAQPSVSAPEPLPERVRIFRKAIAEAETRYDGGLPPDPLAA